MNSVYRIPTWAIHLSVWLLVGGVFLASTFQFLPFRSAVLKISISFLFAAFLFYGNAYTLFPKFFEQKSYWSYVSLSLVFVGGVIFIRMFLEKLWFIPYLTTAEEQEFYDQTALFRLVSSSSAAFFLGFFYSLGDRWIHQENERNRIKVLEYKTELRVLKNQLSPHFLFNAINNVYSLALDQDLRTAPMLLEISQMLRYLIYRTEGERVKLTDEIQFLQTLITLYSLKYEDLPLKKLSHQGVHAKHPIAPLLLLPFIENMFKHGYIEGAKDKWVLTLSVENQVLTFLAQNPKNPTYTSLERASGVGIENTKKRLALIYPSQYRLDIQQLESFFSVQLILSLNGKALEVPHR
ncbi:MAG: sensor histidine kinase [Bacteroidota bacterium]